MSQLPIKYVTRLGANGHGFTTVVEFPTIRLDLS